MRLSDKVMAIVLAAAVSVSMFPACRGVEETVALAALPRTAIPALLLIAVPAVLRVPVVRPQTQAVVPVRPAVQVPAQKKRV